MDGFNRALTGTCSASYAFISNCVCHNKLLQLSNILSRNVSGCFIHSNTRRLFSQVKFYPKNDKIHKIGNTIKSLIGETSISYD